MQPANIVFPGHESGFGTSQKSRDVRREPARSGIVGRQRPDGEFWTARSLAHYTAHFTGIEACPVAPGELPTTRHSTRERDEFADFYADCDRAGTLFLVPGGRVHADLAWAKLRTLAEGARLASQSLWP